MNVMQYHVQQATSMHYLAGWRACADLGNVHSFVCMCAAIILRYKWLC